MGTIRSLTRTSNPISHNEPLRSTNLTLQPCIPVVQTHAGNAQAVFTKEVIFSTMLLLGAIPPQYLVPAHAVQARHKEQCR